MNGSTPSGNPPGLPSGLPSIGEGSTTFERKALSRANRYLDLHPTATKLPPHILADLDKIDRHHSQPDPAIYNKKAFDTYQLAQEIEHDLIGRTERHQIRQKLADYCDETSHTLHQPELSDLAERLRRARISGALGVTPEGGLITAWDEKTNCVRVDPDEAREETQRLARKYGPEILRLLKANPRWRLYYAVYTTPNASVGQLAQEKRSQYKRFSNFHRSKWAKNRIKGSFVVQEDPLSAGHDWNVHLNALHIVDGDFSYKALRQHWGHNVEIRRLQGTVEAIAKAFLEVIKYAAKHIGEKSAEKGKAPGLTEWPPERFYEWWNAGKAFRRTRTYGCLYKFKGTPDKGADLDEVSWIGQIRHDGTAYQCHLKSVDLILADNFASTASNMSAFLNRDSRNHSKTGETHHVRH